MRNITVKLFLLLISISFSQIVFSQKEGLRSTERIADLELTKRQEAIGEKIKNRIEETLNRYYPKESYIIQVEITLERVGTREIPGTEKKTRIGKETFLPGLPMVPLGETSPELREILTDQLTLSNFRIVSIMVNVLLDERKFNPENIEFVKKVIPTCVTLDEMRGDILRVKLTPFPPVVKVLSEEKGAVRPAEGFSLLSSSYFQILIVVLLFLLLVIILFLAANLRKAKRVSEEKTVILSPPSPATSPQEIGTTVKETKPKTTEEGKGLFPELRQLMVMTLVGNPDLTAEIFKHWMETEKEEGINLVASFLRGTDPRLMELLSAHLDEELKEKVESALTQITIMEKDKVIEIFKRFREEFQREQQAETGKRKKEDMFYFLKQLEPHQIFHILKDEPAGVIAIALAMVNPEIAIQVIKELPEEKRIKIPVEMGKLKKIPLTSFSDIADALSRKTLQVESLKYVTTDGVKALVNLLDHSSPEMEKQILSDIAHQDIGLAEEIKKQYLTFDDLILVPNKPLAEVLRTLEGETITRMLSGAVPKLKEKVLSNLPARLKTIVSDTLSAIKEEGISTEEVQKARKELMLKLRDLAKSGKLELSKEVIS